MKFEHTCYKIYGIELELGDTLFVHLSCQEGDRPIQIGTIDAKEFQAIRVGFPPASYSSERPSIFIVPAKSYPASEMVVTFGEEIKHRLTRLQN
jgi:hypothetical protein